ncbi:MAG: pyridoxamine 5'-phosphate oxidase [Acidimicrobiaceae bacterium]|nr:pyridoxamine 5'-phosphate oxidase [Acidimicrobiaceae bacterium]
MRDRRIQYETDGLDVADVDPDPVQQWRRWHFDALESGLIEPNAMSLATVDPNGVPDARIVLVRGADDRGLTFYTNYTSAKSRQLEANPVAAATFGWLELHRQVRVRGSVVRVDDAESDAYFETRPRGSQIGAWASPQSRPIGGRADLDALVAEQTARFDDDEPVPRPPHWGGWRLVPDEWEFWQGRASRLHDRVRYRLTDGSWHRTRLAP